MTTKSMLIAMALIAAVVAGMATRWGRSAHVDAPARQETPAPLAASSAASPKEPATATGPSFAAPPSAPAWRSAAASAAGRTLSTDKTGSERQARMAAVKHALDQMGPQDRQDPRKVSEMLLRLEQANGSPNINGIHLDVLRQNLAVATQLQALTGELQALRAEVPEGRQPSKEQADRIKAKLAQITTAQKQLRTDFMDDAVVAGNAAAGQ